VEQSSSNAGLKIAAFALLVLPVFLAGSASAQDLWTDGTSSWFIASKWCGDDVHAALRRRPRAKERNRQ